LLDVEVVMLISGFVVDLCIDCGTESSVIAVAANAVQENETREKVRSMLAQRSCVCKPWDAN
jgi:hypothetical protein